MEYDALAIGQWRKCIHLAHLDWLALVNLVLVRKVSHKIVLSMGSYLVLTLLNLLDCFWLADCLYCDVLYKTYSSRLFFWPFFNLQFFTVNGLGLIPGVVGRFDSSNGLRVPHIGWNALEVTKNSEILNTIQNNHVYFVHSYRAMPVCHFFSLFLPVVSIRILPCLFLILSGSLILGFYISL